MNCNRCRKEFEQDENRCPYCGEPNPESWALYQTSTVLIAVGRSRSVYRSVEEVPAPLRTRLMKSTNGSNSATILIADRRGRQEISRAMRSAASQKRLVQSILNAPRSVAAEWLTPARKRGIIAGLLLIALVLLALMFRTPA